MAAPADIDFALVGGLEQAGDMQQRRFARARGRHQRDRLSCPQRELGAVENGQRRRALGVLALYLVEIDDRYIFRPCPICASLVPESFDGIEASGTPGRIQGGEERQGQRHDHHRALLAEIDFGWQLGKEIELRREQFGAGEP